MKVIQSTKAMGDGFKTDNGMLYSIWVQFTDDTGGMAFAQSQEPPYKQGDYVEVTLNGKTKTGKDKLKIKKADPADVPRGSSDSSQSGYEPPKASQSPSASAQTPSRPSYNSDGARQGMIVNNCCQLFIAGKGDMRECHTLVMQAVDLVEGAQSCFKGSDESRLAFPTTPDEYEDVPF